MSQPPLQRRQFLQLGLMAGGSVLSARFAFAAPAATDARLVFIILRGALDGLSAVVPYGDPDYARLREQLAVGAPGTTDGALALDGHFGLNPGLRFVHEAYGAGEALIVHAVATAYRERSHFDGQDVLESGVPRPHASQTGWLNRAVAALPANNLHGAQAGVALGQNVPLVLRGPAPIASWSPSKLPEIDDDTLQRIADRYASDAVLSQRLGNALSTDRIAAESADPGMQAAPGPGGAGRYLETVRTAAGFLKRDDGPAVAVFDTSGWDTHFNEGGGQGQLTQRLTALDTALRALKESLGSTWSRTAVLIATEFGRTAAANGTRGTDHGTAAAAFLLGGAVHGGRVLCDWPGLSARDLYQGRDLRATLDLRSVMKSVLRDHLQISPRTLDAEVFPDSKVPYVADLMRA
ncbi:MAG TPA: DUF1501 domain-containing protein [Steroidobacteraceae bacterium]|jgi:uncharacterized protein (DUF1501 family)